MSDRKIAKLQFRQDSSANWESNNPVLSMGEPAYAVDTGDFKIGDGIHKWSELASLNTPDLEGYIKTTDKATTQKAGIVRIAPNSAITVDNDGVISVDTSQLSSLTAELSATVQEHSDSISSLNSRVNVAEDTVNNLVSNTADLPTIRSDISGIRSDIERESHFRGYFSTNDDILSSAGTLNDFAYSAQSHTVWVYEESGWTDSGKEVPSGSIPASTTTPLADGEASIGESNSYARADHRHPSDDTKVNVDDLNALLMGGNNGDVLTRVKVEKEIKPITLENFAPASKYYVDLKAASEADWGAIDGAYDDYAVFIQKFGRGIYSYKSMNMWADSYDENDNPTIGVLYFCDNVGDDDIESYLHINLSDTEQEYEYSDEDGAPQTIPVGKSIFYKYNRSIDENVFHIYDNSEIAQVQTYPYSSIDKADYITLTFNEDVLDIAKYFISFTPPAEEENTVEWKESNCLPTMKEDGSVLATTLHGVYDTDNVKSLYISPNRLIDFVSNLQFDILRGSTDGRVVAVLENSEYTPEDPSAVYKAIASVSRFVDASWYSGGYITNEYKGIYLSSEDISNNEGLIINTNSYPVVIGDWPQSPIVKPKSVSYAVITDTESYIHSIDSDTDIVKLYCNMLGYNYEEEISKDVIVSVELLDGVKESDIFSFNDRFVKKVEWEPIEKSLLKGGRNGDVLTKVSDKVAVMPVIDYKSIKLNASISPERLRYIYRTIRELGVEYYAYYSDSSYSIYIECEDDFLNYFWIRVRNDGADSNFLATFGDNPYTQSNGIYAEDSDGNYEPLYGEVDLGEFVNGSDTYQGDTVGSHNDAIRELLYADKVDRLEWKQPSVDRLFVNIDEGRIKFYKNAPSDGNILSYKEAFDIAVNSMPDVVVRDYITHKMWRGDIVVQFDDTDDIVYEVIIYNEYNGGDNITLGEDGASLAE